MYCLDFQVPAVMYNSGESELIGKPVRNISRASQHPQLPQRGSSTFDPTQPSRYVCVYIHHTQQLDSQAMFQSNCKSPLYCIPRLQTVLSLTLLHL